MLGNIMLMELEGVFLEFLFLEVEVLCVEGVSVMYLVRNGVFLGLLVVLDFVKGIIWEVLVSLKEVGILVVMVIGDGIIIVKLVVNKFGIFEVYGEVKL